jgi:hypothetical protein
LPFSREKGSFYFRNTSLILNSFGYSITSDFSINGGFDFISLFEKEPVSYRKKAAFYIWPRYNFSISENIRCGTSFLYVRDDGNYFDSNLGVPMLSVSYGDADKNIDIGSGCPVFKASEEKVPFLIANGLYRLTNRIALEAEYFDMSHYRNSHFVNFGLRFIARNLAVDSGMMNNRLILKEFLLGIPFLCFTVKLCNEILPGIVFNKMEGAMRKTLIFTLILAILSFIYMVLDFLASSDIYHDYISKKALASLNMGCIDEKMAAWTGCPGEWRILQIDLFIRFIFMIIILVVLLKMIRFFKKPVRPNPEDLTLM